ncbi:hypothetical protein SAMN05444394_3361 [Algoriphagus halophilus]|uniref:Uncharacterized protein n=1 Tax=Algoriphagus halophilus TaxID=226505 RepID=A0A1N6GM99_9BACT|nr:hypothetical protein SAMN05444394_3361 [Algoriphagus halophilus]
MRPRPHFFLYYELEETNSIYRWRGKMGSSFECPHFSDPYYAFANVLRRMDGL